MLFSTFRLSLQYFSYKFSTEERWADPNSTHGRQLTIWLHAVGSLNLPSIPRERLRSSMAYCPREHRLLAAGKGKELKLCTHVIEHHTAECRRRGL